MGNRVIRTSDVVKTSSGASPGSAVLARLPDRFSAINKLILRDLNKHEAPSRFYLYDKDKISEFLKNPQANEQQLRNAVVYLYGASTHFKRLIQYFVSLSDLSYVVSPYRIDTSTFKPKTARSAYRRVLNLLASMDLKNQLEKILTVCFREDTFYGTIREGSDSTIIQQLPSDYCKISVIEDNVLNVTFDFSYFDMHGDYLRLYPEEFRIRYDRYKKNTVDLRYQELDSPNSFAIKCNKDILSYSIPPFAGILREIYDLEDYKNLKLTKTELENYAILVMTLGINSDGEWEMDYDKAVDFWRNLDGVLPDEIGSVLSPMKIDKISFERTHTGDTDTIAEAEQNLFTAAGVSSLLFNNEKAMSGALLLSIKADQSMTYSLVKSIESMLNRYIHRHTFGKYFKITFLDCSPFNRKDVGDAYLKGCQYGLPFVNMYAASQGLSPDDVDCMNYLEDTVLNLKQRLVPLRSSATMSSNSSEDSSGSSSSTGSSASGGSDPDAEPGRPEEDIGELTDSGEVWRERDEE